MEEPRKVAIVTGAAAGIGRAIALRLARERLRVVVSDIDEARGRRTANEIVQTGGEALFVRTNAGDEDDVVRLMAVVADTYGRLDVLVNNAGIASQPPFPEAESDRWHQVVAVNLIGPMLATQLAIRTMRKGAGGVILNVSSVAGLGLEAHGLPDYAATKAAMLRLTACLAGLGPSDNIRVNAICPDWVATEANVEARASMTDEEWRAAGGPDRMASLEAIAEAAMTLIGDDALAGEIMSCPLEGEWGLLSRQ